MLCVATLGIRIVLSDRVPGVSTPGYSGATPPGSKKYTFLQSNKLRFW